MQKRCVFKAEHKRGLVERLKGKLFLNVFADDNNPENNDGGDKDSSNQFNFEQMVAQARKEEKDKLYPRIKKLEDENKTLTTSTNKYLLENAALKDEIEKLKANAGSEDPKVKELESEIETLKVENKSLKESSPNEEEIRKKVEAEFEVKMYAQEQIAENKDSIVSILIPDIIGATKEEIDTAITSAKEKTLAIKKDLGLDVEEDEDKKDTKKKKTEEKKEKPKKAPVAVPTTEDEEEYDAEYIRNLDPRSEEYKEFRKKMGLR